MNADNVACAPASRAGVLSLLGLQHGFDRHQAGALGIFRLQALDMLQAAGLLLSFEHPLNLV
jgi:hypothetical protein